MIVAITGSHSTGKSTIVNHFINNESVVPLNSVTRTVVTKEERKIDGINNLDNAQLKILESIKDNIEYVKSVNEQDPSKVYLMDRCVFDFISYSRAFYNQGTLSKEVIDKINTEYKELFNYIDLFVYLPIEFDIVDDGIRSLDNDLRVFVDNEIQNLLSENKVKYIKLTGDVETRIQDLQTAIDSSRSN